MFERFLKGSKNCPGTDQAFLGCPRDKFYFVRFDRTRVLLWQKVQLFGVLTFWISSIFGILHQYVLSSKICAFICEERERYFMQISPRGHQRRFRFCIPASQGLYFSLELCFEAAFLGILKLLESKERKSCCMPKHSPLLCCLSHFFLIYEVGGRHLRSVKQKVNFFWWLSLASIPSMEYLKNSGSSFILFREKLVLFLNSCDTFLPQTSLSNSRRRWQSLPGPFSLSFTSVFLLACRRYFSFSMKSVFLSVCHLYFVLFYSCISVTFLPICHLAIKSISHSFSLYLYWMFQKGLYLVAIKWLTYIFFFFYLF